MIKWQKLVNQKGNIMFQKVLLFSLLFVTISHADDFRSVNCGIRCGYEFGTRRGFTIGIHGGASIIELSSTVMSGVKTGIDYSFGSNSFRPGIELMLGWLLLSSSWGVEGTFGGFDPKKVTWYQTFSLGYLGYISYKRYFESAHRSIFLDLSYPVLYKTDIDLDLGLDGSWM